MMLSTEIDRIPIALDKAHNDELKHLYGGKATNLAQMLYLGVNIPPGFVYSTDIARDFWHKNQIGRSDEFRSRIQADSLSRIASLEKKTGRKFGAATKAHMPLLVSVRSGAPISMPGMMDTVLNVGLNDKSVKSLATNTNSSFAWDCYRRFIYSFATTVIGLPKVEFDFLHNAAVRFCGNRLSEKMNKHLVIKYQDLIQGHCAEFPQNVHQQLEQAIMAVFKSWDSERAIQYRIKEGISDDLFTACTVQAMVFGNLNENSATGVYFTRNPVTGHGDPYGDFLPLAQGEDVVDGSHKPLPLKDMRDSFPEPYSWLMEYGSRLEKHFGDMCDIEFTVEDGVLYLLQVRVGKRSHQASIRIPFELVLDGRITVEQAVKLLPETNAPNVSTEVASLTGFDFIGDGLVAMDGNLSGVIAFTEEQVKEFKDRGDTVIFVAEKTDPDDMPAIIPADAVVTLTGGLVSHAAVVARSWNKPCIVGLNNGMVIYSYTHKSLTFWHGNQEYVPGDAIVVQNGGIYLRKSQP